MCTNLRAHFRGTTTEFSVLNDAEKRQYLSYAQKCQYIYAPSCLNKTAEVRLWPLYITVPVVYSIDTVEDHVEIVIKGTETLREWLLNLWALPVFFLVCGVLGRIVYLRVEGVSVGGDPDPIAMAQSAAVALVLIMFGGILFLTISNVLKFLRFLRIPIIPRIPIVHTGYKNAARKIVDDNKEELGRYKKIRVMGHSLGGGVASGILSEIENENLFPNATVYGFGFNKSFYSLGLNSISERVVFTELWSKSDLLTVIAKPLTIVNAMGARGVVVGDKKTRQVFLFVFIYFLAVCVLVGSNNLVLLLGGGLFIFAILYHSFSKHGMQSLLEEMNGGEATPFWKYFFG